MTHEVLKMLKELADRLDADAISHQSKDRAEALFTRAEKVRHVLARFAPSPDGMKPYTVVGHYSGDCQTVIWNVMAKDADDAPLAMIRDMLAEHMNAEPLDGPGEPDDPINPDDMQHIDVCAVFEGHLNCDSNWLCTVGVRNGKPWCDAMEEDAPC